MKLLAELSSDSRTSTTQLAKRIGLSKEATHYRMKKLEEKHIKQYYTIINPQHMGYKLYVWFVQLKGISAEQETEYLRMLKNHPNITYIGKLIGKWNATFNVFARDDEQLEAITADITRAYAEYIENYTIIGTGIREEVYTQKFFGEKQPTPRHTQAQKQELDETDKNILSLLGSDARITYATLAEHIDLSAPAIKNRIKRLEKNGTIQGYTVDFNIHEFGFETYVIQLKTNTDTQELLQYLREHNNVFFTYTYLGHANWDVDVGIYVQELADIRTFLIDLKQLFGEKLQVHDMYIVAEILTDNSLPEGVFI